VKCFSTVWISRLPVCITTDEVRIPIDVRRLINDVHWEMF
jgi:hypothetical protein